MKLDFIPLARLSVSRANMRYAAKTPDVSDILPTVRKRGIIQPLIVRPTDEADHFEILGGARRFHAAKVVAEEQGSDEPIPCAILQGGDDAAAVEASLIENLARLDPDEVTQWETFTRLVREGRKPDDIAATFGMPDAMVRRILALGNLLPRLRDLYRREKIDAGTVRHLTMASKSQQKHWLALYDDPKAYAPTGNNLRSWLFGGQSIKAEHALFPLDDFTGTLIADLFGGDRFFADPEQFWTAQNGEIDARREVYLDAGWREVVVVGPGERFQSWEYEKTPKRKGGKVYVVVRASGEVAFNEGYLSRKDAARARRAIGDDEVATKPARPEISAALTSYVDLHRHAAARAALINAPGTALRMMVAHAIVGSPLWRVAPDPQNARIDAITESVENSLGETRFDEARRAVLALLDLSPDEPTLTGGNGDDYGIGGLFLRLCTLDDAQMFAIIAVVMGESLHVGSAPVALLGEELRIDMADWWEADQALFDLIRDRETLIALVGEVAGQKVADANAKEKGTTLKTIIAAHLEGCDGRPKVERWVPRWMAFPAQAYTERGGVATVAAHAKVAAARAIFAEPEVEGLPQALAA